MPSSAASSVGLRTLIVEVEGKGGMASMLGTEGLRYDEAELVAWLVGNHLEMSDTAQRRDISDPQTIAKFTERVGNLERLRLLLILTVADIRAVGPGVWGPVSLALRNSASEPLRRSQSVRITTHSPALIAPCLASQALM
mgnify:CR=1 FL=1